MKRAAVLIVFIIASASSLSANDLWFPQIAAGGGYTTRIRIAHVDTRITTPVSGRIFFYNQDGSARTVTTLEAGAGSSFAMTIVYQGTSTLTITGQGNVSVGSAVFRGVPIFVGGVATYTVGATAVGILPAREISLGYVPVVVRTGFTTGIAVANSSEAPIDVQFSLWNPGGSAGQTGLRTQIPVNGQIARLVGPELGFNGAIPDGSTLQVAVNGTGRFAAVSLLLGNGYISSQVMLNPADLQTPLYIPQVAVGGNYSMVFRTFNSSDIALAGTLRFRDTSGRPMAVTVSGTGGGGIIGPVTADSLEVPSVPPKGAMVWEVSAAGLLKTGYAIWESYLPANPVIQIPVASGVSATVFNGQVHVGESGTTAYYSAAIPVDVGTGINTGVALATAGLQGSNIRISLRDSNGVSVSAPVVPFLNPLPAGSQISRYASELFGNIEITGGYLIIESTGPDGFLPLGITDTQGTFSTTATIRRYTIDPSGLAGTYTGRWADLMAGITGPVTLNVAVSPNTSKTLNMSLNVDGSVFGTDPPPLSLTCGYTQEGCISRFTSAFGPGTFYVQPDGTMSAISQPNGGANTFFRMDGYLTSRTMWAADSYGANQRRGNGFFSMSK